MGVGTPLQSTDPGEQSGEISSSGDGCNELESGDGCCPARVVSSSTARRVREELGPISIAMAALRLGRHTEAGGTFGH